MLDRGKKSIHVEQCDGTVPVFVVHDGSLEMVVISTNGRDLERWCIRSLPLVEMTRGVFEVDMIVFFKGAIVYLSLAIVYLYFQQVYFSFLYAIFLFLFLLLLLIRYRLSVQNRPVY